MPRVIAIVVLSLAAVGVLLYSQRTHGPVTVSGFVEAQDIRVGSRVGGRTATVLVREGDHVKRGDVLVTFDPFDWNEKLAEAEAALAGKNANLAMMKAGMRREEVAQAKAMRDRNKATLDKLVAGARPLEKQILRDKLAIAEAELPKAQRDYERLRDLVAQGIGSQDELAEKTRALESAQARLAQAKDELALAEEGTRAEELAEARANVDQAQAEFEMRESGFRREQVDLAAADAMAAQARVDAIRRQIEELKVLAPCDGYIEAIDLRPGDLVPANAPVATVIDPTDLWVRAYVPERFVKLEVGTKLPIRITSMPERSFAGELTYVAREAEFSPANVQTPEERSKQVFRVKVTLRDGLDVLRAGMTADVVLQP